MSINPWVGSRLPDHQPDCTACNSMCCGHIAINLAKPTRKADYDHMRWYLMHERVHIGIDLDGDWMLEMITPCRNVGENGCANYEKRPNICKNYPGANEDCEFESEQSPYRQLFTEISAFERYLTKKKIEWQ
jgi:Fe-S-cluster containining protein